MPFTPFHFGPGAALHALAPRHVSFLSFCTANVLIDVESLINLLGQRHPVHAFFHTYVGATWVIAATVALFVVARRWARHLHWPDPLQWQGLSLRQVALGAALGAYTHVLLDSVMHSDIRPLAPFSPTNPLLLTLSLDALHQACLLLGAVGAAVLGLRWWVAQRQNRR
ncbi:MAG TPA: hypothetical protein VM845_00295 [Burkholderiaceae bacterium]|jgi:hypothetical protein|nr:hypothetical protein [Burkholderiaceae bacterium]